jgi:hypothetical protein
LFLCGLILMDAIMHMREKKRREERKERGQKGERREG